MGDPDQEAARRICHVILREFDMLPTQLARVAGVWPTTITRFLNNPDVKHTLSMRTLRKIQEWAWSSPKPKKGDDNSISA